MIVITISILSQVIFVYYTTNDAASDAAGGAVSYAVVYGSKGCGSEGLQAVAASGRVMPEYMLYACMYECMYACL